MHVRSLSHHGVKLGLVAVLSVLGAACADENSADGSSTDEVSDNVTTTPQNLVAEVQGDGYTVKFYEPEPGLLVEDETGSVRARHFLEDVNLDSVQRYELIAGRKAPLALVQAAARAGALTHEGDPVPARAPASHQKAAGTPTTEQWFRQNYCARTDRFWGSETGYFFGNTSWSDRVEYMRAGAFAVSAPAPYFSFQYHVSYNGAGSWSWDLAQGQYAGKTVTSRINRAADSGLSSAWGNGTSLHCVNYHF